MAGNPGVTGIAPGRHFCSDWILTRILEHTHRTPRFTAPSLAKLGYEMRPDPPTADTFLVAGIVLWTLLHRMNEERVGYQAECYSPSTRPYILTDAIEIATICQGVVDGRIQGVALPACSLVYRAGSIIGIRFEPTLFGGELSLALIGCAAAPIYPRTGFADFGQFRTAMQSFSHFLADMAVVTFGPGYYRICLFREKISNISDFSTRMEGMTNPSDRIAQLTPGPPIAILATDMLRSQAYREIALGFPSKSPTREREDSSTNFNLSRILRIFAQTPDFLG